MENGSTENERVEGSSRVGRRRAAWLLLFLLMLTALTMVLTPAWLIQPFRPQSQSGLAVSYALRRWSPIITLIAAVVALAVVLWLWRGARRWWLKSMLAMMLLLTLAATWFARQNHFEWMFNPLANAAYARTGEADFVADTDMVLAIELGGESVAYPVRLMAYHHVVQDTVGGTPIVATY
jgi:glucan phosphoethanolaminetransferase (alkaline phosphatase superfamily)